MTKTEALKAIIAEAHKEGLTPRGYKTLKRALAALGCTEEEQNDMLQHLEYHDSEGNPPPFLVAKK